MISWFEKHYKISWVMTIFIAGFIFYISSLTFSGGGGGRGINKAIIYHIAIFLFLSLFLLISTVKGENKNLIPMAIILAVIYAVLDEIHQSFVPGRNPSIKDIYLDSIGIMLASVFYLIRLRFKHI